MPCRARSLSERATSSIETPSCSIHHDTTCNDMRESVAIGMASGAFRSADATVWAQALIGMSLQVVSWWIEQEGVSIEEVARSLSDLALHGIAKRPI